METKPQTLPGPYTIPCERCGETIKLFTHAQAKSCGCSKCSSLYEVREGKLSYKKTLLRPAKPLIQIETRGNIDDIEWTVTGFAVKKDSKYGYSWREYTLFHPISGYSYLSEYDGHWMYLMPMNVYPGFDKGDVEYNGTTFHLYSKYKPVLEYAHGEFPHDITDDNKLNIQEYINPPEILSHEYNNNIVEWMRGWYLDPSEVADAFKCKELPSPVGIGVIQPQPFSIDFRTIMRITIVAALGLLALQFVFDSSSLNENVFSYSGTVNDSTAGKVIVSQPFELKNGKKNLLYSLYADVDNSWFETDVRLVNEKTNEVFAFEHGVEHYHGYDSDGSWTEGNRIGSKILEAVPEGTYHLLITPIKNAKDAHTRFDIALMRDVPRWSNFWKALLVLAIFPAIQFYRTQNFEKQRWMESDYSPYDE